ncbi:hypothetical protein NQ314_010718 [Rhamnusium bicolor]|uniref:Uncharacterized protein n=1 Tax=Rhamnusium bicolor TaxID=1586634 RepID=A0AAV8XPE1_9CUCU|nr:hypothetical protein NQ314_010718 [Rhamnusium bicolor]
MVSECKVGNGQTCVSIGYVSTLVYLGDKFRIVDILVIHELSQLILEVDFWVSMNIIPDLRQCIWHLSDHEHSTTVCSIVDEFSLNSDQKLVLERLIESNRKLMGTILGRIHLDSHEIELPPGTRPIKQRY